MSSFGQLLDLYLENLEEDPESVYMYLDKNGDAHIIVSGINHPWDYPEILTIDHNVKQEIEANKKTNDQLKKSIKSLERDKKLLENAVKRIAKMSGAS